MLCPFCAEEIKDEAVLCRYCKQNIKVSRISSKSKKKDNSGPISRLKELSAKSPILVIMTAAIVLLVGGFFGFQRYSEVQEQKRIVAEQQRIAAEEKARIAAELEELKRAEADYSWVPEGFIKFSINPYVAYKVDPKRADECSRACFPITVVANKNCPTLYIQSNAIQNEVILDWANDTVYGLVAGQKAEMLMRYSVFALDGGKNRFTEVNCY